MIKETIPRARFILPCYLNVVYKNKLKLKTNKKCNCFYSFIRHNRSGDKYPRLKCYQKHISSV